MTSGEHKVLVDVMLSEIGTAEKYNALVFDLQDEIAKLRDFRDCWRSLRSVLDSQIKHLEGEVVRLRITDAERGAIESALHCLETQFPGNYYGSTKKTIRGLLERMAAKD